MILSAFSLEGKVAVVTGCDTGLGQGMALGLAQAGCDIISIALAMISLLISEWLARISRERAGR